MFVAPFLPRFNYIFNVCEKHKLGADRVEKILAVPCNPQNRLKNAGPEREIGVRPVHCSIFK